MPFTVEKAIIKQTESKLGAQLPLSYVAAMLKSNGGTVKTTVDHWQLHPIFDPSDKKRLKRTCNDIIRETQQASKWHGFPLRALAIGANGGGDLLVFLKSKEEDRYEDAVYWWDHETGAIEKVADDFIEISADG